MEKITRSVRFLVTFGSIGLLALAAASLPRCGYADESLRFLAGGDLGVAIYNRSVGTKLTWGLHGKVRFGESLEGGLGYRAAKLSSDEATSTSVDIAYFLAEVAYRMPMGAGHFTAGIEAGSAKVSTNLNLGVFSLQAESEEKIAFGPKIGYAMVLSEHIEAGITVDYLTVFTSQKVSSLGALASIDYLF